jgi:uncharacterized protein (TIGR03437 family)
MRCPLPLFTLGLLLAAAPILRSDVSYLIDSAAGSDQVGDGGPAVSAQLANAHGIAADRFGNIYISDADNHRVRKVTAAGVISTIAGNGHPGSYGDNGPANLAQLNAPYGLAVDAAGNVYVADFGNHRVRRISTDGVITTIAGNGQKGSGGDGGPASAAQLMSPRNLVFDSVGNLYISEFEGHRVRRVGRDGIIGTIAGTGLAGLNLDPKSPSMPGALAQLAFPAGLAVDSFDNVYVADSGNNLIRRISGGFILTVLDGRTDPAFLLYTPTGIAIDRSGFLYVTDSTAFVREVYGGQLRSVAGTGDAGNSGDGGYAASARLTGPHDLAFDNNGSLYIADGCYVRKVWGGKISTLAGNGYAWGIGDGLPATLAQLKLPAGLALDPAGNLFIADSGTERIRKVDPQGFISTVAGAGQSGFPGDGVTALLAQLASPSGVAADAAGNVYIADTKNNRVRKVLPSGFILTIAGSGIAALGAENTFAPLAPLNQPRGVALDANGTLYIADTGNHRVVRITQLGTLVTVAGNGSAGWAGDNGRAAGAAQLNAPSAITFDTRGNLYIADTFNHLIRKITPAGIITTVAGTGAAGFDGDGGPAIGAMLNYPGGIAVDSSGALYIADTWNHRIRQVDGAGIIHTIAGSASPGYKGDGGAALAAQLNYPSGAVIDAAGAIYFSDTFNNRVRKLLPQAVALPPAAVIDVGVVNSASQQPGPVAQGELVSIFAPGIGPEIGIAGHLDAAGMQETSVGETQVLFDGVAAPLFYIQSGQINLQIPYGVSGSTQMEVLYKGDSRVRRVVPVADSAVGIFPGTITNEDGSANSAENAAPRGSRITFFATGEGPVAPAGVTGRTGQAPYAQPVLPVSLSIGGNSAGIISAAAAPGLVGQLKVEARVPDGFVPTGILPVVLTVGQSSSQFGITIAVK